MIENGEDREMLVEWFAEVLLLRIIVAHLLRRAMSAEERRDLIERLQVPSASVIPFKELHGPFERAKEDLIVEILRGDDGSNL